MISRGIVALLVLCGCIGVVTAHSWLGCADYRGPVDYYDDDKCYAYPRNWQGARGSALAKQTNGYELGVDTGYNYQGTDTAACQFSRTTPPESAYTTDYPMAIYEQGATYCLAWPTKNHVAAQCTNQYIPDTSMALFRSSLNPTADPTQTVFKQNPVTNNFGTHSNGQIDCLGYQRSPRFCDNTDKAMATGCFTVPSDLPVGYYVYQWYWIFNPGQPYTTCWDAQVVAAGSGRGAGGLTGSSSVSDTLASSSGGSLCTTNWGTASTSAGVTASTTPTAATSTGLSTTPTTPTTTTNVALNGDSIRIISAPVTIPTSGGNFMVGIGYSAQGPREIIVDILDRSITPPRWYGKGTVSVYAASQAVTAVTVTIDSSVNGLPNYNTVYDLHAWMVDATVYDQYEAQLLLPTAQQNSSLNQPWTKELDSENRFTLGATTVTYENVNGVSSSFSSSSIIVAVITMMCTWIVRSLF